MKRFKDTKSYSEVVNRI